MTDNPLDADKDRQQRISERAYHLWQSEGELHGHDREYWERAEELIGMEDSAGAGQLPNPMNVPGSDPSSPPMVEEASIQENLGEFPGQTDQGEHLHTPSAAATHDHAPAASDLPPTSGKGRSRKEASTHANGLPTAKSSTERKDRSNPAIDKGSVGSPSGKTKGDSTKTGKSR